MTWDNLVPVQYMGNSGCYLHGKRAAIVRCYPADFFPLCAVFSCFQTTGCEACTLLQMDTGSLTFTHIWVLAVYTKGDQAQTSPHKRWLGGIDKFVPHPAPPGDRTQGLQLWILTLCPLSHIPSYDLTPRTENTESVKSNLFVSRLQCMLNMKMMLNMVSVLAFVFTYP